MLASQGDSLGVFQGSFGWIGLLGWVQQELLSLYFVLKMLKYYKSLVAYYSQKMTPLKLNYNIYNKELLNIVTVLKEWRAFLQRTAKPFIVKKDHKNLTS